MHGGHEIPRRLLRRGYKTGVTRKLPAQFAECASDVALEFDDLRSVLFHQRGDHRFPVLVPMSRLRDDHSVVVCRKTEIR